MVAGEVRNSLLSGLGVMAAGPEAVAALLEEDPATANIRRRLKDKKELLVELRNVLIGISDLQ